MIWSGSRLNFCQALPGPHFSLGRFFFQQSELRETFPWIWQMSVRVDIPAIVNSFLLQQVQISVSWPRYINVFHCNRECFFLRHTELNSKFIVMTIDEVTLNRPEVGTGFSVICWFCRLSVSQFTLKFSTEIFAPYGLFPPWSVFSEIIVSSWQLCCIICYWEDEFISFLWYQCFFRVDPSKMNFWCVQLL